MSAYAILVTHDNLSAIQSENPKFDLENTLAWLATHDVGYFIRDEESAFDCHFMADNVFEEIYKFEGDDSEQLFRRIRRI